MFYSYTHMATVGVKGLKQLNVRPTEKEQYTQKLHACKLRKLMKVGMIRR